MKASVAGRVRHTALPKSKALLPLFEAVMNAFQSIEECGGRGHRIVIRAERMPTLTEDSQAPIEAFVVTDTGVGFTDQNYDSFQTVDSPYKAHHGGKGLGRFIWLKAFRRVEIESHYAGGDKAMVCRSFEFLPVDQDEECRLTRSNKSVAETRVALVGLMPPYVDEVPRDLSVIANRLIAHFLPLFFNPDGPQLLLVDGHSHIDLRASYQENFQALATKRKFTVGQHHFTLNGFRVHGALADHHAIIYAAHFREVMSERLAKFLPNLKAKLNDSEQGDFYYLAFIQGELFDEKVNSERTDFLIPKEEPPPSDGEDERPKGDAELFVEDEVSLSGIRDAAMERIRADLQGFLDDINQQKEAAIYEFVAQDAPQYRFLMKHKADFIDRIAPNATKSELDMALHREQYRRQVVLKKKGKEIIEQADEVQNREEYYERFRQFVEEENEAGKSALAQYVVHRRVILELLQKALSRDPSTGDHALEKVVHQLVFPMRMTSDDVPFEQQNLWIIDERLTFHSFLSSDQPLSDVRFLKNDSSDRPDLLIFDRPLVFSEGSAPLHSMVVVEFKKPALPNTRDENPVEQVYRIVRKIRSGHMEDKGGREIRVANDTVPAYCYIVCDLTRAIEERIQNMGARRTPDNLGYYGFNETLNAYYEVISYAKLLSDAKKRNHSLFDKLNMPTLG